MIPALAKRAMPMDEHKPVKRDPSGLALAGGGPLGSIYEVGALVALDEALRGLRLNDCDVFVGVSSGAFFASGLANGLSPREMHARFIETTAHDDPFEPEVLLKLALREYGKADRHAPPAVRLRVCRLSPGQLEAKSDRILPAAFEGAAERHLRQHARSAAISSGLRRHPVLRTIFAS